MDISRNVSAGQERKDYFHGIFVWCFFKQNSQVGVIKVDLEVLAKLILRISKYGGSYPIQLPLCGSVLLSSISRSNDVKWHYPFELNMDIKSGTLTEKTQINLVDPCMTFRLLCLLRSKRNNLMNPEGHLFPEVKKKEEENALLLVGLRTNKLFTVKARKLKRNSVLTTEYFPRSRGAEKLAFRGTL